MKVIEQPLLVDYEVEAPGIGNIRAMAQGHLEDGTCDMI